MFEACKDGYFDLVKLFLSSSAGRKTLEMKDHVCMPQSLLDALIHSTRAYINARYVMRTHTQDGDTPLIVSLRGPQLDAYGRRPDHILEEPEYDYSVIPLYLIHANANVNVKGEVCTSRGRACHVLELSLPHKFAT